jgi:hypothetical protein
MSAVCILAPVVVAAWPAFSAAVVAAAGSLGYAISEEAVSRLTGNDCPAAPETVQLEIPQSEIVTGGLGRDQRISVVRDGITVTFSRDARGRAAVCVTGTGQSESELRLAGEELSRCVVQQYVYQRLMQEVQSRGYLVVDENRDQNGAIHMRIRHWEN